MNTDINTFINSGLLERYMTGETSVQESKTVEEYIYTYPEVQIAYYNMQRNLEIRSKRDAIEVPTNNLDAILSKINNTDNHNSTNKTQTRKLWYTYSIAASITALLFAGAAYLFYNQNLKLETENQVIVDEIFDLRNDIQNNNLLLDEIMRQFQQLNDPNTEKYVINGNNRAKNLKTVAYINAEDKTSIIDAISLPKLHDEQYYEIWAELQDRMISLGILKEDERKLINIPYANDVLSLNITVENKNTTAIADADKTVASLPLKKQNKTQ